MFDLAGQRVFVAGGSSGIGLATAKLLLRLGASVVITGRNETKLAAARAQLDDAVQAITCDITDPAQRAVALATTGAFDHLVLALSGGKGAGPFDGVRADELRTGFDAKFWTHFSLAQESLPQLSAAGSITFVTAISARAANPGTAGLAAINAAIEGMVKPLAVELRPLRVNAVAPGVVDTPWWDRLAWQTKEQTFERFAQATPAGRIGQPEDLAQAIVFLIGNTFMTGCVLECDGGLRLVGQRL